MRVVIEPGPNNGFGTQYRLKLLDGYRAGQFVRIADSEQPLFDVDQARLAAWARDTGYEVVLNPARCGKTDTPADLGVFRASRTASPVGDMMRKHLKL